MGSGICRPGEFLESDEDAQADSEEPGSELVAGPSLVGVSDIVVDEKDVVSIGRTCKRKSAKR